MIRDISHWQSRRRWHRIDFLLLIERFRVRISWRRHAFQIKPGHARVEVLQTWIQIVCAFHRLFFLFLSDWSRFCHSRLDSIQHRLCRLFICSYRRRLDHLQRRLIHNFGLIPRGLDLDPRRAYSTQFFACPRADSARLLVICIFDQLNVVHFLIRYVRYIIQQILLTTAN